MVFGNLGNMAEIMKQAKKMQDDLKKIKEEIKRSRYENEVNGVRVVISGEMDIMEFKLNPALDIKKNEESAKQALSKVLKLSKDDAAGKMKSMTGGLSIPGLT